MFLACSVHCADEVPLQKLLFSATLSQNPEKLQRLHLVQPRLITAVVSSHKPHNPTQANKPQNAAQAHTAGSQDSGQAPAVAGDAVAGPGSEFIGKYTTPAGLSEYLVQVALEQKPMVLLHFLMHKKFKHVLCFTNSTETTHRYAT